mmetsp:Transcript_10510/g.28771  ORF Transcript_10510/g.28771 Transcript_10510/m.28771 type:complete len:331 (-) Transcript_10510:12-1004(-)
MRATSARHKAPRPTISGRAGAKRANARSTVAARVGAAPLVRQRLTACKVRPPIQRQTSRRACVKLENPVKASPATTLLGTHAPAMTVPRMTRQSMLPRQGPEAARTQARMASTAPPSRAKSKTRTRTSAESPARSSCGRTSPSSASMGPVTKILKNRWQQPRTCRASATLEASTTTCAASAFRAKPAEGSAATRLSSRSRSVLATVFGKLLMASAARRNTAKSVAGCSTTLRSSSQTSSEEQVCKRMSWASAATKPTTPSWTSTVACGLSASACSAEIQVVVETTGTAPRMSRHRRNSSGAAARLEQTLRAAFARKRNKSRCFGPGPVAS